MPTVTRRRTLAAPPARVWTVIANPERLVDWWPNVQRVEEATPKTWTTLVVGERGRRALRADYTRVELQHSRRIAWRHEVEETPFERVLASSVTTVELEPAGDAATEVTLSERIGLRGFARLGGLQVRLAARKRLDRALAGLERTVAGRGLAEGGASGGGSEPGDSGTDAPGGAGSAGAGD